MSSVDTRPVPVTLLRWPRTRDLITQHKAILLYLWPNPAQTACGCYLLPLDATAADLSMTASSLADALSEFRRRGLIVMDESTGEILLPDWFRFYQPRTPAARGAVESSIRKIISPSLREKAKKAYESTVEVRKGKDKDKDKDKVNTTTTTTTAPSAPVVVAETTLLVFETVIPEGIREALATLLEGLPTSQQQDLLDTLADALQSAKRGERETINNPLLWLSAIATSDTFDSTGARHIQQARRRSPPLPVSNPVPLKPSTPEVAKSCLAELRQIVSSGSLMAMYLLS